MGSLSNIQEELAARLKAARDAIPATQAEVAKALGCSLRSYQEYEAGRAFPRPATRRRIAVWLEENEAVAA